MLTAKEILEWDSEGTPAPAKPLIVVEGLVKDFTQRSRLFGRVGRCLRAVDGVSFTLNQGETISIVGPPGCGKTTMARLLMHLIAADAGTIAFGNCMVGSSHLSLKNFRAQVQMVFQDGCASLNPRLTIASAVAYGAAVHGVPRSEAIARSRTLLLRVGLDPARFADCYPYQLSAQQCRRVTIARALAVRPRVLILDEVVSLPLTSPSTAVSAAAEGLTLDLSLQDLLRSLKDEFDLSYICMGRDLEAVRPMSDRVMLMHLGRVAEFSDPVLRRDGSISTAGIVP